MSLSQQALIILGMALVTAVPRVAPLLLLSSRNLPERVLRFLEMIPPAVLAALLAQEIVISPSEMGPSLNLSLKNIYLIAAIPTVLIGWIFKNFFITVLAGIVTVALLRLTGFY